MATRQSLMHKACNRKKTMHAWQSQLTAQQHTHENKTKLCIVMRHAMTHQNSVGLTKLRMFSKAETRGKHNLCKSHFPESQKRLQIESQLEAAYGISLISF